jgi:hypothetical protein
MNETLTNQRASPNQLKELELDGRLKALGQQLKYLDVHSLDKAHSMPHAILFLLRSCANL